MSITVDAGYKSELVNPGKNAPVNVKNTYENYPNDRFGAVLARIFRKKNE